jgi:hypothetical protein
MIRFAWLQSRAQAVIALGALAVAVVVLAMTGPHLVHVYNHTVANCAAHGDCDIVRSTFLKTDKHLRASLDILVIVLPGIIGIFWGAPLAAREFETGTYRLAWTQSVTRTRWLAVKLAVVGTTAVVVVGLFSLMVTWWARPIDKVNANRFSPPSFDERGIVAIGYVAFAFALGVTIGLLVRRTIPAMATTLGAFVFAWLAFIQWIRPNLMAPLHRTVALEASRVGFGRRNDGPFFLQPDPPNIPNAWIYSTHIVDKAGHALTPQVLVSTCPSLGTDLAPGPPPGVGNGVRVQAPPDAKAALTHCVEKIATKYHEVVAYQPARNYWAFQWIELAIFIGAALALGAFCLWWVRRRA